MLLCVALVGLESSDTHVCLSNGMRLCVRNDGLSENGARNAVSEGRLGPQHAKHAFSQWFEDASR